MPSAWRLELVVGASAAAILETLPLAAAARMRGASQSAPTVQPLWTPLDGPQTQALESEADELFYGGSAGGGKTDLLLGLALTRQWSSIIFRREYKQLRGVIERSREIIGAHGRLNETSGIWRLNDGRMLELGAVEHEHDKDNFQGRPHALKGFDELPQFTESQYRFLIGWNRSTRPNERRRTVGTGNPPTNPEGEWVVQRWAAWLDEQHPNPAEPGELRWYAMVDGDEIEREDGNPFDWHGEVIQPRSRTFIPARLSDNPLLEATGYRATLQAMPEPLRSQMLYGDFTVGLDDDPWQVIPTSWVRAAQARWTPDGRGETPLTQVGIDIAQGGSDQTVFARRYGRWFEELEAIPGPEVPDANVNAKHVERVLAAGGTGLIDADGIGASTYFLARARLGQVVKIYKGSGKTIEKDRGKVLSFLNVRAAAYWRLREALDPSAANPIALPPSRELRVELCATRYVAENRTVKLEKKEKIKERLGRSPDFADAVVMAFWEPKLLGTALSRAMAPEVDAEPDLSIIHGSNKVAAPWEAPGQPGTAPARRRMNLMGNSERGWPG